MNAATAQLEADLSAVDTATSSEAEAIVSVKAAMKEYETSVEEVATQVGCTT